METEQLTDQAATPRIYTIRAAHKDYSARGRCRQHWYRMVYRDGAWSYFARDRLSRGAYYAADRHQTVYGDVRAGEYVCEHNHGAGVDTVYRVAHAPEDPSKPLIALQFHTLGDKLIIRDGDREVTLPNPRR